MPFGSGNQTGVRVNSERQIYFAYGVLLENPLAYCEVCRSYTNCENKYSVKKFNLKISFSYCQ